jgi:hypothetical protein
MPIVINAVTEARPSRTISNALSKNARILAWPFGAIKLRYCEE